MKLRHLFFLFLIPFACSKQEDNIVDPELESRIERVENGLVPNLQIAGEEVPEYNIEARLKALGIPGLSIAVAVDGEVEWAKGYGMADRSENRQMTKETMLLAGSISKPVAAVRAHQLVEQGVFDLDENVNEYLKSWQVPDNEFTVNEKVTLRRILNHTAGLTVWGFPGYDKGDTIPSTIEVLDGKGNTDSVRVYKEPGASWMYSGGGYTIMQLMIEDQEGNFTETLQDNVLGPLNMEKSTFENPLPNKYHISAATGYRGNGDEVEGKWPIYPEMAAAGLWTTPSQLVQYGIEIQNIYQTKEDGILKYKTVEEMLTPGMNGHGLGPGVSEFTFGHGGADEGFRARLIAWKDQPYAVVVMVNSDNGKIIQEILLSVVREYELPGIEPNVKTVISMSNEQLEMFEGDYELERFGGLKLKREDDHLLFIATDMEYKATLLPDSDSSFFDPDDGSVLSFNIENEEVTGFEVQGLIATKVVED